MKNTGVSRSVDDLGRIVIPKEIRDNLGIDYKDKIDIFTDNDLIILNTTKNQCAICNCNIKEKYIECKNKCICLNCYKNILENAEGLPRQNKITKK